MALRGIANERSVDSRSGAVEALPTLVENGPVAPVGDIWWQDAGSCEVPPPENLRIQLRPWV